LVDASVVDLRNTSVIEETAELSDELQITSRHDDILVTSKLLLQP